MGTGWAGENSRISKELLELASLVLDANTPEERLNIAETLIELSLNTSDNSLVILNEITKLVRGL